MEKEKINEVDLLVARISALEEKIESKKVVRKFSIKKLLSSISEKIFTKDNLGLLLSFLSLVMSSCVVAYLVFG